MPGPVATPSTRTEVSTAETFPNRSSNSWSLTGLLSSPFFESNFSVYVVSCEEFELIAQTNRLGMIDVVACRDLLAREYGKSMPDAALPRSLGELWLSL